MSAGWDRLRQFCGGELCLCGHRLDRHAEAAGCEFNPCLDCDCVDWSDPEDKRYWTKRQWGTYADSLRVLINEETLKLN